jgi:hypothetical protein
MKRCLHCGSLAEFSLCIVVSTLGVSNRRQKSTTALPFCASCLQRVFSDREFRAPARVGEALNEAYRALTPYSIRQTDPTDYQSKKRSKENGELESAGINAGIRTTAGPSASGEVVEVASRYVEEKGPTAGDSSGQGRQELEVPRQPTGRLD